MLNTRLALPGDAEELALTLNAKKRKINKADFDGFAVSLGIPEKVYEHTCHKFSKQLGQATKFIETSFLKPRDQEAYIKLMQERAERAGLIHA
jgi:serine/threonine-protein kinase HipA